MIGYRFSRALVLALSVGVTACVSAGPDEASKPVPREAAARDVSGQGPTEGNREIDFGAELAAAERGDATAQFVVGVLHALGAGVEPSTDEAIRWYEKAAERSGADAQYNLAEKYNEGVAGRPVSDASRWLRTLSRMHDPRAPFKVGSDYHFGADGLPEDPVRALHWYELAASHDHVMAWYRIGDLHLRGRGVPRDWPRAHAWFTRCAERDLGDSAFRVGELNRRLSADELAEAEAILRRLRSGD